MLMDKKCPILKCAMCGNIEVFRRKPALSEKVIIWQVQVINIMALWQLWQAQVIMANSASTSSDFKALNPQQNQICN